MIKNVHGGVQRVSKGSGGAQDARRTTTNTYIGSQGGASMVIVGGADGKTPKMKIYTT